MLRTKFKKEAKEELYFSVTPMLTKYEPAKKLIKKRTVVDKFDKIYYLSKI